MDERKKQFRVGMVVLGTIIMASLLAMLNSSTPFSWARNRYEIRLEFLEAPGVGKNTPIRKNGILIGRVYEVVNEDSVVIVAKIDEDQKIRKSDVCRIRTSLLGDSTINFSPGRVISPGFLVDGDQVVGQRFTNPIDLLVDMQSQAVETVTSLRQAGDSVRILADNVNQVVSDATGNSRATKLLDDAELAIAEFTKTMRSVDSLVGDPDLIAKLKTSLDEFPAMVDDFRGTLGKADSAFKSIDTAASSVEVNLQNLQGLTGPLGKRGDEITNSLSAGAENMELLLAEVTRFTKSINNPSGSIGQLIHSRKLYDEVEQAVSDVNIAVGQINGLLHYLNRRIPPIVEDVRVITDKVAREPGRLLGGALKKGPGIK